MFTFWYYLKEMRCIADIYEHMNNINRDWALCTIENILGLIAKAEYLVEA